LTAIGIQTGNGDDTVVNNGFVSALIYRDNDATSTTGIDLGEGNDALTLGADSVVVGTVTLGNGDDSLTLIGTPIIRNESGTWLAPQANAGNDSLFLQGAGAFPMMPGSFEHATKSGAGTYSLPGLATLDTLTIDEGILQLGSNYDFGTGSEFSTYFHSEGDSGMLNIIGSSVLDGAIDVEKRGNTYISSGSRYTVVGTTNGVSNGFANITLPESRPLLSFGLEQTINTVDIVAFAESFSMMASNGLYRQVASNLDTIADVATGDFNVQLGTLQGMMSGFDLALASLAPDS
jgi:hypothetical protein